MTKKIPQQTCMVTMNTLLFLFVLTQLSSAVQIVVAPNGNDAAVGSRAHPIASLEHARDMARAAIQRGETPDILLRGGTYSLTQPLALGVSDSGKPGAPIVWRAAQGETVRLSAGRMITGWRPVTDAAVRERLDPAARDRVRQIDLKAQGITDYGDLSGGAAQIGNAGLELFVDDAPMHISRYPNAGFIPITEVLGKTPIDVRGTVGAK